MFLNIFPKKINKLQKYINKCQLYDDKILNHPQDWQEKDLQVYRETDLLRPDALYRMAAFRAAVILNPVFENAVADPPDQ